MTSDFKELASVNGEISPTGDAVVPLKDDGLYRGDGAFEVIRLYGGRPFALDEHVDSLESSAAGLPRGGGGVARPGPPPPPARPPPPPPPPLLPNGNPNGVKVPPPPPQQAGDPP